jgi:hypothetical protein
MQDTLGGLTSRRDEIQRHSASVAAFLDVQGAVPVKLNLEVCAAYTRYSKLVLLVGQVEKRLQVLKMYSGA